MQVLHPRCAGLDVHKDGVVAAVRLAEAGGTRCEVRSFDPTTKLLAFSQNWPKSSLDRLAIRLAAGFAA